MHLRTGWPNASKRINANNREEEWQCVRARRMDPHPCTLYLLSSSWLIRDVIHRRDIPSGIPTDALRDFRHREAPKRAPKRRTATVRASPFNSPKLARWAAAGGSFVACKREKDLDSNPKPKPAAESESSNFEIALVRRIRARGK